MIRARQRDRDAIGGLIHGRGAAGEHLVAGDLAAERECWQVQGFTRPIEHMEEDRVSDGHAAAPIGGDKGTGETVVEGVCVLSEPCAGDRGRRGGGNGGLRVARAGEAEQVVGIRDAGPDDAADPVGGGGHVDHIGGARRRGDGER